MYSPPCLLPVLICYLYSTDGRITSHLIIQSKLLVSYQLSVISYQLSVISDSVISDQMSVFILNPVIKK